MCEAIDIAVQYSFAAGLACTRVTTLTQLRFLAIACSCEVQDILANLAKLANSQLPWYFAVATVSCSRVHPLPLAHTVAVTCFIWHVKKMVGHIIQTRAHVHGVVLSCMKPINECAQATI